MLVNGVKSVKTLGTSHNHHRVPSMLALVIKFFCRLSVHHQLYLTFWTSKDEDSQPLHQSQVTHPGKIPSSLHMVCVKSSHLVCTHSSYYTCALVNKTDTSKRKLFPLNGDAFDNGPRPQKECLSQISPSFTF